MLIFLFFLSKRKSEVSVVRSFLRMCIETTMGALVLHYMLKSYVCFKTSWIGDKNLCWL